MGGAVVMEPHQMAIGVKGGADNRVRVIRAVGSRHTGNPDGKVAEGMVEDGRGQWLQ